MPENYSNKSSSTDKFVQEFFTCISPKTASTFTDTQLIALKQAFGDRLNKRHAVDIRLSIPFFKRGFYIVLLLGKEKRVKKR